MHKRPLSPHLSVYKMGINAVLSIFHRITGVFLFLGLSAISWFFVFFVFLDDGNSCECLLEASKFLKYFLYLFSYMIFYHCTTGVRHLIMDMGHGYSVFWIKASSLITIACSIILFIVFWLFIKI